MKEVIGGVCAPKGFRAGGIWCGIRKNKTKSDLAMIVSDTMCTAAGVYTKNKVKGAPIVVTKNHLADGHAQAVICNSGNANTCAPNGLEIAEETCALTAKALGLLPTDIIVASTGVIGKEMEIGPFATGIPQLADVLTYEGSQAAAHAIMTTDTKLKEVAVEFTVGGKTCHIGGIAKGSGMIHPNMGTMLGFITTDCNITHEMLQIALVESVRRSYNRVSVDGDTSTNDMCIVMANGLAGNEQIDWQNEDFDKFYQALHEVNVRLARMIAGDGEGATKLITCTVKGARSEEAAERLAKAVCASSLVKAAMFGADANWGRVLCAIGYSGMDVDISKVKVTFKKLHTKNNGGFISLVF